MPSSYRRVGRAGGPVGLVTTPDAVGDDRRLSALVTVGAEAEYPVIALPSGTGLLVSGHSTCRFCRYSQAAKIADHTQGVLSMVYVRLEKQWTDGGGVGHAAGEMVDVDAATLAKLQAEGVVGEVGTEWVGPTSDDPSGTP